jgi:hypothetical protein
MAELGVRCMGRSPRSDGGKVGSMRIRAMLASAVIATSLVPAVAEASIYNYAISTNQEYGLITGTMGLTVDALGNITGGDAQLTGAGLTGTVDFSVVTSELYCSNTCYGWRSGDGTDFYGFDNTFTGSALNDVVFHSGPDGTGYTFGVYWNGSEYLNGLFGPGGSPNFYSYDISILVTPATESVAAPLPSTWTMMLIGFAGLGFFAYRGSKNGSAVAAA